VRKLEGKGGKVMPKKGKEDHGWDYMEVMACLSGCVNEGGQLPASKGETVYSPKEWLKVVEENYRMQAVELCSEEQVEGLYRE
jgi:iron only hydrogenase large subunit-like protein